MNRRSTLVASVRGGVGHANPLVATVEWNFKSLTVIS